MGRLLGTLLIKSDLKWCIHHSKSLYVLKRLKPCTGLVQNVKIKNRILRYTRGASKNKAWPTDRQTNGRRTKLSLCNALFRCRHKTILRVWQLHATNIQKNIHATLGRRYICKKYNCYITIFFNINKQIQKTVVHCFGVLLIWMQPLIV